MPTPNKTVITCVVFIIRMFLKNYAVKVSFTNLKWNWNL